MKIVRTTVSAKEDIQKRGVGNLSLTNKTDELAKGNIFQLVYQQLLVMSSCLTPPTNLFLKNAISTERGDKLLSNC